jgi:hypothetical protein
VGGNDLNDLNFLCAAAGYADITIGGGDRAVLCPYLSE